jgi:hypothetical protein
MGVATVADTVPGGYLYMAFLASIVFAFAGLALPHGALSLRVALLLLLTASFCLFLHFGPCMPRNGVRTCLFGIWNEWVRWLGYGAPTRTKGHIQHLESGLFLHRVWVMLKLTGLRRRWSVYGVYDNEWGNEQDDGVVETGHSGMQRVTGMSKLSCSFRWPRTLQRQS